jgi:hypothetical protein
VIIIVTVAHIFNITNTFLVIRIIIITVIAITSIFPVVMISFSSIYIHIIIPFISYQVWVTLLEDRSVPVKRITSVVELAVDRLRDKTAAVRRQALCVLTALLENHSHATWVWTHTLSKERK